MHWGTIFSEEKLWNFIKKIKMFLINMKRNKLKTFPTFSIISKYDGHSLVDLDTKELYTFCGLAVRNIKPIMCRKLKK